MSFNTKLPTTFADLAVLKGRCRYSTCPLERMALWAQYEAGLFCALMNVYRRDRLYFYATRGLLHSEREEVGITLSNTRLKEK